MAKPYRKEEPVATTRVHDIVTGGIEGGVGVLALEPLLAKLAGKKVMNPLRGGSVAVAKRIGGAAAVGAGATGLIGALVEANHKRRMARMAQGSKSQQLQAEIENDLVEFRKLYAISQDDEGDPAVVTTPNKSRIIAGLEGAGIGGASGAVAGVTIAAVLPGLAKRLGKSGGRVARKVEKALGGKIGAAVKIGLPVAGITAHQNVMNVNEDKDESEAIAKALRMAKQEGAQETKRRFDRFDELKPAMIEFEDDWRLRSGVRLDKYKKTIEAHEIDRKIGDHVRAATLGAIAGVALPTKGSLKQRAIIGAAGGVGLTAALHYNTPKDEYGEQSEAAKLVQKRTIQGVGAAAIIGGIIARKRQIGDLAKRVRTFKA
jgi:hypothetical protein